MSDKQKVEKLDQLRKEIKNLPAYQAGNDEFLNIAEKIINKINNCIELYRKIN